VINEKAKELGRLLGQTSEYKAVVQARQELNDASEVRAQMQRLEMVTERLERDAKERKEPPKEVVDEYENLMSSIQGHPRYQRLIAAQSNFDKIMMTVNEQIMEGLKLGAESSIIMP
jgi:cell fate (sporulation/competence/biofilm development) regulator YlbF (YheA/YmcA/DUF963 family)